MRKKISIYQIMKSITIINKFLIRLLQKEVMKKMMRKIVKKIDCFNLILGIILFNFIYNKYINIKK